MAALQIFEGMTIATYSFMRYRLKAAIAALFIHSFIFLGPTARDGFWESAVTWPQSQSSESSEGDRRMDQQLHTMFKCYDVAGERVSPND